MKAVAIFISMLFVAFLVVAASCEVCEVGGCCFKEVSRSDLKE